MSLAVCNTFKVKNMYYWGDIAKIQLNCTSKRVFLSIWLYRFRRVYTFPLHVHCWIIGTESFASWLPDRRSLVGHRSGVIHAGQIFVNLTVWRNLSLPSGTHSRKTCSDLPGKVDFYPPELSPCKEWVLPVHPNSDKAHHGPPRSTAVQKDNRMTNIVCATSYFSIAFSEKSF